MNYDTSSTDQTQAASSPKIAESVANGVVFKQLEIRPLAGPISSVHRVSPDPIPAN